MNNKKNTVKTNKNILPFYQKERPRGNCGKKGLHMENTKIGNKEAVALLITITFNHLILNVTKAIIDCTSSASLLNILYISIITIIFTCIICNLLNKFPTFDLIDISSYLGGKLLKWIIGLLFIAYFTFFSGILLHLFSAFLQIAYFPYTRIFFIIALFLIATLICCRLKYNAIYRSALILLPAIIVSTIFLFLANINFYNIDKIYPIFGYGINDCPNHYISHNKNCRENNNGHHTQIEPIIE